MTAATGLTAAAGRVGGLDWEQLAGEMNEVGCARSGPLLDAQECSEFVAMLGDDSLFRSTIEMGRYRFGSGRYRYFADPVPEPVARLREAFWPHLLPIARDWADKLGRPAPWPDEFGDWLAMCHDAGQTRPTPILFTYGEGDWNALHQDLYGALYFPMQVVVGLNEPEVDHTGGEFLLLEQRPRAQSRGTSITLGHGEALVFTTRDRPVASKRGWSKGPVRHGVSTVRSGERHTLALVLHDAE